MGRSPNYKDLRRAAGKSKSIELPSLPPPAVRPTIVYHPRNPRQQQIQDIWPTAQLIIATGPAGTGKTSSAFAGALADVFGGAARKVVLARPVVGVDEDLGYFPGTLEEKLGPWMGAIEDVCEGVIGASFEAVAAMCDVRRAVGGHDAGADGEECHTCG